MDQILKCLQIPLWEESNHIQFLHKAVHQKLLQGKKNTDSKSFFERFGIDSNTYQICIFLVPKLVLPKKYEWVSPMPLPSWGSEKLKYDSLVSLFLPPKMHVTWYMSHPVEPQSAWVLNYYVEQSSLQTAVHL